MDETTDLPLFKTTRKFRLIIEADIEVPEGFYPKVSEFVGHLKHEDGRELHPRVVVRDGVFGKVVAPEGIDIVTIWCNILEA
jgi:hypothetical protein